MAAGAPAPGSPYYNIYSALPNTRPKGVMINPYANYKTYTHVPPPYGWQTSTEYESARGSTTHRPKIGSTAAAAAFQAELQRQNAMRDTTSSFKRGGTTRRRKSKKNLQSRKRSRA